MKFLDNRFDKLSLKNINKDISSGITVGVVAVPLAMAFAIASGLPPIIGLYTAVISGFLVSLLGGSKYQIAGPTGAFIPVISAILYKYNYEGLLITTFISGIIILLLSFFKIGRMIKFMPISVTVGFTSGIAIVIFFDQIDEFLGITYQKSPDFHNNIIEILKNINNINIYSIITAIIGIVTIYILTKFKIKIPVLLTALIIPTLIATFFYPNEVSTIGSVFGEIPNKLPDFKLDILNLSFNDIKKYISPAFTIAFLGALESLLSASVADSMTNSKMNPDKELFGQGIANIVTPLFGGIPSTGAIARTATNIQSGAVSPLSGVVHSMVLLICILFISPLASYIPLAAMASILMRVAYNMSEIKHVFKIIKTKSGDTIVLLITMLLTVFIDLTIAVEFGIILSILIFIRQMSLATAAIEEKDRARNIPNISIITFKGPLFFGATGVIDNISIKLLKSDTKVIILNMHFLPIIDITASENLHKLIISLKNDGYIVYLSHIPPRVYMTMEKEGILDSVGHENIFFTTGAAIESAVKLLKQIII